MNKVFRKIISLLMVSIILVGLCACGGDNSTGTSGSNKVDEVRDLKGRTIRFLANWNEPTKGNSDFNNIYWAMKTKVEKEYNCKYEHVYLYDTTVYDTFITSILSGNPMADIICYKKNPFYAMKQGLFYDLKQLDEFDFTEDKWLKATSDIGTVNDKQYLMFSNKFVAVNLIFYNKDVFEQYGQEDLWTLQKAGKLTTEKFISIATAISKATGKNSMRVDITADRLHNMFAFSKGISRVSRTPGTYDFKATINTTEFVNAFKQAQKLIDTGVCSNGLDSSSWTYSREQFNSGNLPILMGSEDITGAFQNSNFNVGLCVMPTDDGKMTTMTSSLAWCAIPYNVENPGDVAFVWNKMTDVTFDVDYKIRYQDVVSDDAMDAIEALSKLQTTENIPVDYSFVAGVSDGGAINKMITGAMTPAQALQTIEPLYTNALKGYKE